MFGNKVRERMMIDLGLHQAAPCHQMIRQIKASRSEAPKQPRKVRESLIVREPLAGACSPHSRGRQRFDHRQEIRHALSQQTPSQHQRCPRVVFFVLMLACVARRARAIFRAQIANTSKIGRAYHRPFRSQMLVQTALRPTRALWPFGSTTINSAPHCLLRHEDPGRRPDASPWWEFPPRESRNRATARGSIRADADGPATGSIPSRLRKSAGLDGVLIVRARSRNDWNGVLLPRS